MDPLFKWPGGKSRELPNIRPLLPGDWDRYVEPFAGGAAVFFDLEPPRAILNDINPSLMSAYSMIAKKPRVLEGEMREIARARRSVARMAEKEKEALLRGYRKLSDASGSQALSESMQSSSLRVSSWADRAVLLDDIRSSVRSKLQRTYNHEKRGGVWSDEDVLRQIETGFHAGLYTYIRDHHPLRKEVARVAQFLYLREFAYGGMFRFNQEGRFNIPYGGFSYNGKSLSDKIDSWVRPDTVKLLRGADIRCGSFEELDRNFQWTEDDFFFLDPPYDTEFSDYDQFEFGAGEQKDLARWFTHLPAKALMIIGKTPAIEKLYREAATHNSRIQIEEYEKTYAYNVRGRNERQKTHLAIRNYSE